MTSRKTLVLVAICALLFAACASNSASKPSASQSSPTAAKRSTAGAASRTGIGQGKAPERSVASAQPAAETIRQGVPGEPAGTMRMRYTFGPISIEPGQNNIAFDGRQVPKPKVDGYILRIAPDLIRRNGTVPPVDVIHLHHGVWLNMSVKDSTFTGFPERFFAAGEEKTVAEFPPGYGYAYKASDRWLINYMLHNLTPNRDEVYVTYEVDFLPADSPAAKTIHPARPIWMDVENGKSYPVFDALRGSGTNGRFTYPDQASDPYRRKPARNTWTVDRPGTLIATGGHMHPGGMYDDLNLTRAGAAAAPGSPAAAVTTGSTTRLFRSEAHYWEPAGAVSWDVGMTVTPPEWRVAVRPGDVLSTTTTYDTRSASWYESMGIMVAWMADDTTGADPFAQRVDAPGHLTHGHLPENDHHGGQKVELADLTTRPDSPAPSPLDIIDFVYARGDMSSPAGAPIPSVKQGQTITFNNKDAPIGPGIWHTVTACKAPCNRETGVAYPLADADVQFDSGELGATGPPASGAVEWKTPATLPTGTYTYFCRIHPFMRGAFRVLGK